MPPEQDRRRRLVLDTKRSCAIEEPLDARTIERARPPGAIRSRESHEQLEIDLLRQPPERAVGHGIARTVIERFHFRKQLMDYAQLARQREADRRAMGLQQQLFELTPDALGR